MLRRTLFASVFVAVSLAGSLLGRGPTQAAASGASTAPDPVRSGCALLRPGTAQLASIGTASIVAVSGGELTVSSRGGPPTRLLATHARGTMLRHVASDPRYGLAYIEDHRGPDTVVVRTDAGVVRLPQGSEATHPTWSPSGELAWSVGTGLRIRSRAGRVTRVPLPARSGAVFSPVFGNRGRLFAVTSGKPTSAVPEDERVNNIWSFDRYAGRWHQLTHFTASADRWTAVRTPVRTPSGAIEFVRISGRGSATGGLRFQLWRMSAGSVHLVRRLASERYLATYVAGQRVWDVPDLSTGTFHLVAEGAAGRMRAVGCGVVQADPLDAVDPDRSARRGRYTPPRGHWPGLDTAMVGADQGPAQVAILVGDYATKTDADAAAARIKAVYGTTAPVEVVDSTIAPEAIRAGVFGAVLHLPVDADVLRDLDAFRARLPEYATTSWVVTV